MRRLFSLWKVLRQHCVFTQLYTLPSCFSSPDLCYHVPGRNLIKWHRALLSLPLFPSPISVSDSNSVSGRSGLPLISSVRSHLWAALALSLPQHLPCHLFCCWNSQWTGRYDSISDILWLMHWTEPLPCATALPGMKRGQGFTAGTSGPHVLQLPALHTSFALTSLNLNLQGGLSCTIHF